ncbi:MAG: hypothetical protein ABSH56_04615 [Bryobacteraceae bacterium]|jgi:hypothetical protein
MRTLLLVALMGALAGGVHADGVAGKWTAQVPRLAWEPDQTPAQNTFVFKVESKKLTGSVNLGLGGDLEIRDGEVNGNEISFRVALTLSENGDTGHAYSFDVHFKGKVVRDTIEFARTMDADDYGTPPTKFTAKRVK